MDNVAIPTLRLREADHVIPAGMTQDEVLANLLGGAFHDDPDSIFVFPEDPIRREGLRAFFREAIRIVRMHGQIDATPTLEGAALWIYPGQEFVFAQMIRTGTATIPFKQRKSFKRLLKLANSVEDVHHRLVREPHWYLAALAVEPAQQQRQSIGGALLERGLSRAESDGLLCYLETFQEANLRFYEQYGFRIAGAGCIPGGPNFWAMIRTPQGDIVINKE